MSLLPDPVTRWASDLKWYVFLLPSRSHTKMLFILQSGETALHVAARYGHADVVQLLCSFGSNPNFQDKVGFGV